MCQIIISSILRQLLLRVLIILTPFFFFSKIWISFSSLFLPFAFFFFRKVLISFTCFVLKSFFVFLIIFIYHFLYMQKKKLIFFTRIFFIRIFLRMSFFIRIFSAEFSSLESEETSISSIIYLGIFFSLITYLHSSKNKNFLPVLNTESIKITDKQRNCKPFFDILLL